MAFMINNIDGGPISARQQPPEKIDKLDKKVEIESVDGHSSQGEPADPAEPGVPPDPLKKQPNRETVIDRMQEIAKQQHEAQEANDLLRAILNRV